MEENMTNEESLRLITEMIQKAKTTINENGTSSILWGCVVGLCGLVNFAELYWHFNIGFDIWLLALFAIIPQIIIVVMENKRINVKTHTQLALDAVWTVYGISIFALVLYINVVPAQSIRLLLNQGAAVFQKNLQTNELTPFSMYPPSALSLFLLIYAFPTMVTGVVTKFKPMIFGAALCYGFFVVSLFTPLVVDSLLTGLAGIFNWLIPGILLRKRYLSQAR